MRLLFVIPHYAGPPEAANQYPGIGSYVEPLSRIAALSELIASLHRNFGPIRNTFEGAQIAPAGATNVLDIVIVTMRERNVLSHLGLAAGTCAVEYVEGAPTEIPFHVPRLMKERLGRYDYYCMMEDDLAVHDPAFFEKLAWFQRNFGVRTLLAPTRVESAYTGTPGKVVVDPILPEAQYARFRRPGQRGELRGAWNGQEYGFALPANPHAACYVLTQEQLAWWIEQPTFDDRDGSWVGPLESAATLAVGKVFDIYKPVFPDPFFLEVHHFGVGYAARNPPAGRRYGDPPLLAIAQNALHAAREGAGDAAAPLSLAAFRGQGTIGEHIAELIRVSDQRAYLQSQVADLNEQAVRHVGEIAALKAASETLRGEAGMLRARLAQSEADLARKAELLAAKATKPPERSLRWLARSILSELSRRVRRT